MYPFKMTLNGLPWQLNGKGSACQCRRHRFNPWSGKTPYAAEPLSLCSIAIELQLLKPTHPGAVLSDKKSHGPEKPTCHN